MNDTQTNGMLEAMPELTDSFIAHKQNTEDQIRPIIASNVKRVNNKSKTSDISETYTAETCDSLETSISVLSDRLRMLNGKIQNVENTVDGLGDRLSAVEVDNMSRQKQINEFPTKLANGESVNILTSALSAVERKLTELTKSVTITKTQVQNLTIKLDQQEQKISLCNLVAAGSVFLLLVTFIVAFLRG